jgi:two-component system, cell cycle response regulator DivK
MRQYILLIEDNEQNRYLITFLLEKNGYEVVYATDGPEGIRLARQIQPSLILLDIQLPTMDGYAVARALKSDPATAHISIVAITSYAMEGERTLGYEAGCNGYLEKPIDPETFVAEIARYIPE